MSYSVLPIRITKPYLQYDTGMIVLVTGAEKSELLAVGAGEVFRPEKPMKRSEFAHISKRVPPIAIARGVLVEDTIQKTKGKRT